MPALLCSPTAARGSSSLPWLPALSWQGAPGSGLGSRGQGSCPAFGASASHPCAPALSSCLLSSPHSKIRLGTGTLSPALDHCLVLSPQLNQLEQGLGSRQLPGAGDSVLDPVLILEQGMGRRQLPGEGDSYPAPCCLG